MGTGGAASRHLQTYAMTAPATEAQAMSATFFSSCYAAAFILRWLLRRPAPAPPPTSVSAPPPPTFVPPPPQPPALPPPPPPEPPFSCLPSDITVDKHGDLVLPQGHPLRGVDLCACSMKSDIPGTMWVGFQVGDEPGAILVYTDTLIPVEHRKMRWA